MKVWKDYTIENTIIVLEKAVRAIKPQIINSCCRKLGPDVLHDFIGLMREPIKEILKMMYIAKKKVRGWGGW